MVQRQRVEIRIICYVLDVVIYCNVQFFVIDIIVEGGICLNRFRVYIQIDQFIFGKNVIVDKYTIRGVDAVGGIIIVMLRCDGYLVGCIYINDQIVREVDLVVGYGINFFGFCRVGDS